MKTMHNRLTFVDLDTKDKRDRERLLIRYYEQIYREAFPKADQAEGPEVWLPLMGSRIKQGQPSIHAVLALDETENVLGGQIFENYRISACWLATYLAVQKTARGRGIGRALFSAMLNKVSARKMGRFLILAESENPQRMVGPEERANAESRLQILDQLGLGLIPIDYVQPALAPGKDAPDDLLLLCHLPTLGTTVKISTDWIACFLREFYDALDQAGSPFINTMCEALSAKNFVTVKRLAVPVHLPRMAGK